MRIILLVVVMLSPVLAGCGKGDSPPSERGLSPISGSMGIASLHPSYGNASSKKEMPLSAKEEPAWLTEARNDPDPRVRLHAIETWAIKPGKTLDPVTYALVDPDETVRARAQELFEAALERSNHKNAERVPD